jgi:uncharacterized protein (TIGR02996 family)
MGVYFVYRSHYEGPACKHLKRFEDASVLDWFRKRWMGLACEDVREAQERVDREMGTHVFDLACIFQAIAERGLTAPETESQLHQLFRAHLNWGGEILARPHCLQWLTDDDELEMAYYFFDDHFLARHADRAAFLLREGWQLPGGRGERGYRPRVPTAELTPRGQGEGTTYCVLIAYYDSGNLTHLEESGGWRIRGARLPQFCRYLATVSPDSDWPFELRLLRSQLFARPTPLIKEEAAFLATLQEEPGDIATWEAYSDWLEEHGQSRAGLTVLLRALQGATHYPVGPMTNQLPLRDFGLGSIGAARAELEALAEQVKDHANNDPSRSLVAVQDHVAQLCLHTAVWGKEDLFHQWIFFDDLWASAHPDLARAILRFMGRWDVLS